MDLSSPALKHMEVNITEGEWRSKPYWDWEGVAIAEEAIVAVIFLKCEGEVAWCKSERAGGQPGAWPPFQTVVSGSGHRVPGAPVRLTLFWYDKIGRDVQVNFSIGGGGRRCKALLPWPGYHPEIELGPYVTGRSCLIARLDSAPHVDCYVLFLAAQQVRVGRAGRWNVREQVAQSLEPPLRNILTHAGTGIFRDV